MLCVADASKLTNLEEKKPGNLCVHATPSQYMHRCAQVQQIATHVEKGLGMQVNWLLNNTNASPHMRTNWRVLMYLPKARHVQGFLVVEKIGSAFKTTAPGAQRRDSIVTYDTNSLTPAQLGIRVRTAHSLSSTLHFDTPDLITQ